MRIPSHTGRTDISENMMTPMIDVVFNLLIFFVCASALNIQELVLKAQVGSAQASYPATLPAEYRAPKLNPDRYIKTILIYQDEYSEHKS